MILFVVLFLFEGAFLVSLLAVFSYNTYKEYKKTVRKLIISLAKKGYCPQKIGEILSFYDSGFLVFDSLKDTEILIV